MYLIWPINILFLGILKLIVGSGDLGICEIQFPYFLHF